MYELEDVSARKDQRLKSIRLIELSDHMIRLNRRENTQLELRLRQLKRQEMIMRRIYDRDIYFQRLRLAGIYETLHESFNELYRTNRVQTPASFYAIKMRRNQSAPANNQRKDQSNTAQLRPSTTSAPICRTKRSMSVFKDLTLKPECRTLENMLLIVDNKSQSNMPIRSKTMMNLKSEI